MTITKQQFDVLPDDIARQDPAFRHYDEDPVIQQESKARITQLLAGLPPKRRAVMSAWLAGAEDSEIAKELEISEGTVRSHRRYGLADVAKKLRLEGGLS
ncbi:LuxR C-terminal-related transcriptional regulator [Amycolatopsis sp. NPDC024027]|uniref:RNA polymerase sigma factor n=1 Tax=Amycolatopsis sp. NPDC024027 TaxID=3154327 RepID=UPI0033DD1773